MKASRNGHVDTFNGLVDGSVYLMINGITLYKYMFHVLITKREPMLICMYVCLGLSARFVGDFKMVNILGYSLVDSVDHFNVESRKLCFF